MKLYTALLMGILTGCEIDLFVPSFAELERVFHLTPFMVELTLSVNLIAHCITALIAGNLGDRYGRKPIIIWGLGIFILGSMLCVSADSFSILLIGRFFQGIGISGPAVLSFLIIVDAYPLEEQQQKMGLLNGIITLAMAFGPVIGSYVNLYFNWRGNFWLLLILGILCLALTLVFVPKGEKKPHIRLSIKEYLPVFTNSKALLYVFMICFLITSYWVFIALSPLLYIEDLQIDLKHFGYYQGSLAATFAIVSLSSGYFLKKYGQRKCLLAGFSLLVLFVIGSILLILFQINHPLIITGTCICLAAGMILPVNILWPMSLETIHDGKGRVSAIIASMKLALTSLFIQLVSYFYNKTFTYIGIAMCLCIILSFVCFYYLIKKDQKVGALIKE
ncbi:MAG: multidrug effflux MFS transporter [Alphaproteobacteria bacterium]|nr:multidrug effflux MFS transporter [Alphaproteobacteria bacterium]